MVTPTYTPKIAVRGIRQRIPPGYVVGRLSNSPGRAELIPLNKLGAATVAAGGIAGQPGAAAASQHVTLTVSAQGSFSAGQQFSLAAAPSPCTFPSNSKFSNALAALAPSTNIEFYLLYNLAQFLALGYPNGVLAEINFTAGQTTGTIFYPGSRYTVNAGQVLAVVMPNPADPAFAQLTCSFAGDPT